MLKNFRFYYHYLLILSSKKYKYFFVGAFFLIILFFSVRLLFSSVAPSYFSNLSTKFFKTQYNEGLIGTVDTLNPVYSKTLAEKEINSLVFRGLTKISPDGSIEPDLAESFSHESETKYVFKLKKDLFWHDGEKITVDDVIHTIDLTQNSNPTSEFSDNFKDVDVERIDDYTLEFNLKEPFSPFILNTTIGIVPEHISIEKYKPVGSGDFKISKMLGDKIILESKSLNIIFKIYKTKEEAILALKLGEIDGLGGLSFLEIDEFRFWKNLGIYSGDLQQRQVVVFFNFKDKIFEDKDFRQALSLATPKELGNQILPGLDLKLGETSLPLNNWAVNSFENPFEYNLEESGKIFKKLGWERKEGVLSKNSDNLGLTLTTSSEPELVEVADIIKDSWEEVGIKAKVRKVDTTDLVEKIIPERDFQALLSIQQLSTDPDQYSIWHSSQKNASNITSLESDKIDKILEDGRKTFNKKERKTIYTTFNRILADEAPAVFLYYPKYFWVVNKRVENIKLTNLIQTTDRFKNIRSWNFRRTWIF